jgi:hypothetical protein
MVIHSAFGAKTTNWMKLGKVLLRALIDFSGDSGLYMIRGVYICRSLTVNQPIMGRIERSKSSSAVAKVPNNRHRMTCKYR